MDDRVVPHLLKDVLTNYFNPPTKLHVALVHTCVVLVGELKEWIEMHPNHLQSVLQLLLVCLRERRLAWAAAASLDQVCVQCAAQKQMVENFTTMLQVVKEVDSFHITGSATVSIIKGMCNLLPRFLATLVCNCGSVS